MCGYVYCIWVCAHECRCPWRSEELETESQALVSRMTWRLGTKVWSSGRAFTITQQSSYVPSPNILFFFLICDLNKASIIDFISWILHYDAERKSEQKLTWGVSSRAVFTDAWMPSTVDLLAVPTAAAFSAVAPSLPEWFSKLAALSSNTLRKK